MQTIPKRRRLGLEFWSQDLVDPRRSFGVFERKGGTGGMVMQGVLASLTLGWRWIDCPLLHGAEHRAAT